ncbi:MAG: hypothetical protein COW88_02140 [Candidatus Lloydbacteria bacterium CG22_combo_CG10-13_8_21_14_all_47_15]|uniref:Membrane insertase YidC/Oxa/ALB C-terminal domain-containing protein n=1 Tax=Candidatus Lloydbacteria bacterium CG22_combo_CG10-13_8_21_14_all_47_15 TaxID=1974635 RepID=A0A2H0CU57_9BACT|nr:MAG: hypothetical protein COW88_02140 [Candidatus Lloydbacteria bacterium CG22_combo_CG10-13_8_21_14_all_47_15]
MTDLFNTFLFEPLYNALIFLVDVMPGGSVGFSVIALTLLVKLLLFPLSHKSVRTQAKMRTLDADIKRIKKEHGNDKQEEAKKIMELYQAHGVNPFSGCFLLIIQLPIIVALYWVFLKGIDIKPELIYSFIPTPEQVSTMFLGFIDMHGKSIILAFLAGATQFFQMRLSLPPMPTGSTDGGARSFKDELVKSMGIQMRYIMPVIVAVISYTISAAVALYWTTSNLWSIGHELVVRQKAQKILAHNTEKESHSV